MLVTAQVDSARILSSLRHPSRRTIFFASIALCIVVGAILFRPNTSDGSVPYIPKTADTILEHVPPASSPHARLMSGMQQRLLANPNNMPLALELAQMDIEETRKTGDPRYLGYAQAALAPWWDLPEAPTQVILLRATIRQSVHDFDASLVDLDHLLTIAPGNVQARLTRATVHTVRGEYDAARADCAALANPTRPVIWSICTSTINAVNGQAQAAHDVLMALVRTSLSIEDREWVASVMGEVDVRLGQSGESMLFFESALKMDPTDAYVRTAMADELLDLGEPQKAADLVKDQITNDAMLLRLALAEAALKSPDADKHRTMLGARFAASHERGDVVHRREEARYVLGLEHDADRALDLARANFDVQKEPWDVRIFLESAKAAKKPRAARAAIDFVHANHLEDPKIDALVNELSAELSP